MTDLSNARGIVLALIVLFLVLQLVRPELSGGPANAELQAPTAVKQIIQRSCYPCHSNERRLSWFDEVVPAFWLVASDIKKARQHLNFSELGALPEAKQRAALFQAVNFVREGVMPLRSYTRVHPGSAVTPEQLNILQNYLRPTEPVIPSESAVKIADREFLNWVKASDKPANVKDSPNGIAFMPRYKDWKIVNATTRFDANTLRIILGNDVAIKTIADNKTSPWPDGTTFAKVGWHQQPDDDGGIVRAGGFLKVGFMTKDKVKFASTAGWGWAEWEGAELNPYGNGPGFTGECVTCHNPQRKYDYVFTIPIRTAGRPVPKKNSMSGDLPFDPLQWRVITCGTDPRNATMYTLFGNDAAVDYSRRHGDGDYPPGSVLALVTWQQQEDKRWFGAKTPAETKLVETVAVGEFDKGRRSYSYEQYGGSPLKKVAVVETLAKTHVTYLLSQRAAVMP